MIDILNEHLGLTADDIKKKASMRKTENLSTSAQKKLAKGIKKRVAGVKTNMDAGQNPSIQADRADGYG